MFHSEFRGKTDCSLFIYVHPWVHEVKIISYSEKCNQWENCLFCFHILGDHTYLKQYMLNNGSNMSHFVTLVNSLSLSYCFKFRLLFLKALLKYQWFFSYHRTFITACVCLYLHAFCPVSLVQWKFIRKLQFYKWSY